MQDDEITMVPHHADGQMGRDIYAAAISAEAEMYSARYGIDPESGSVYPLQQSQTPLLSPISITKHSNGQYSAQIRDLAVGGYQRGIASHVPEIDTDLFANWGGIWDKNDEQADMRKALKFWKKDELFYKCVKFVSQLANTRIMIECEDNDFTHILKTWIDNVLGHNFRDQWFREWFRSGMPVSLKALTPYVARNYKPKKIPQTQEGKVVATAEETAAAEADQARASKSAQLMAEGKANFDAYKNECDRMRQYQHAHAHGLCSDDRLRAQAKIVVRRQYEWLKGMVPASYTLLDPLSVKMQGPKEMSLLRQPYLAVSGELRQAVITPTAQQQDYLAALPYEIVQQIKAGAEMIWLSPNICNISYCDKQDYEVYPTPMISHAFDALEQKALLQAADKRTALSVRDRILQVTIGSDMYPVLNDEPIKKIAAIFANPSRSMTIYWNHTLSIKWVEPPLDAFMDPKRYKLCDDRIRTIFGVSPVMTGTSESSSTGGSIMTFKGLEEEVNSAQDSFLEFLKHEIALLKQALGISFDVQVSFIQMNLRDEAEFMAAMQQMVQNGILDPQTAIETLGYHFPTVLSRLKAAKKYRKDGLFLPLPSSNNMGPDGNPLTSKTGGGPGGANPKKGGTPTGGKPRNQPGANNNKNKRGTSQPKLGKASAMKMVLNPSGDAVFAVLDTETLDREERQVMASAFGTVAGRILTAAEYKKKFGTEVKFTPTAPPLDNREVIAGTRAAAKVVAKFEDTFSTACRNWKAAVSGGARAAYMTDKVKTDLRVQALAHTIDPLDLEGMTELEKDMAEGLAELWMDELREEGLLDDDCELKITARVLAMKQLEKYRLDAAAAREVTRAFKVVKEAA